MSHAPPGIAVDELIRLVEQQHAQLVEVLPRSAYEALRLPEAISIPLTELDKASVGDLDRSRPVVVYCYDHP